MICAEMDDFKIRRYENVCQCKRCKETFLFTETMARKISFGLEEKICPKCGSSQITFIAFGANCVKGFVDRFKLPY